MSDALGLEQIIHNGADIQNVGELLQEHCDAA